MELLVTAAVESGRAGELLTLFDNAKSADEENVFRFARIRLMLASGRIEELRRELTRLAETVNQRQLIDCAFVDNDDTPEELKIAKLCHADLRLRVEAEALLLSCFRCQLKNECVVVAGGMRAITDRRVDDNNIAADQPPLKYFSQRNTAIDVMLADEGLLFAASAFPQELQLSFPLQGDFEVEVVFVEAFNSKKGSLFGDFAFPCFGDDVLRRSSVSQFFSSFVGTDVEGVSGRYVRALVTTESPAKSVSKLITSGNTVRYQLNGQEVIVDNARPNSYPWLDLQMNGTIQVESVRITGQPEIPRRITLIDGPRLSGWQVASSEFAATGWAPRFSGQPDAVPAEERGRNRLWVVDEQNCLVGVTDSENEDSDESFALTYMRPMNAGEEVEYEYFYEAGRSVVHPMIGDMALLLSADGIRRRHIRTSSNYRVSGDVAQETTPHLQHDLLQLPLVDKAWNKVSLKWSARSVECWLNGTMVYEYALSSTKPARFGFHRNPSTDFVRIRNVILRGDWPEQIPQGFLKNPIAPHDSFTTEDQAQNTSTIQFFNDEFSSAEDN